MLIERLIGKLPVSWIDYIINSKAHDIVFLKKLLLTSHPEDFECLSQKKILASFKRAAKTIPEYKKFLGDINPQQIITFDDFLNQVPVTDKENYIKMAKNLHDLCVNRDLSQCSLLARSSGYSGTSSTWAKSREEQQESKNFAAVCLDLLFDITHQKTLLIDSFALGSWVSGVDLLMIADAQCSIIAPGADIDDTLAIFTDLKDEFDQIIVAGTPPFLKLLIEEAVNKKIPVKEYKLHLLAGAEGFTEQWRQYMNQLLGNTHHNKGFIYSAYGASDLGVTGVIETKDTVFLRDKCLTNKPLRKAIFKKYEPALPMLFQYDPTKYFIEVTKDDELVFSNGDLKAMMPLIRYNIHDIGGIYSYDEMQKLLQEHGIKMDISLPLPFVFVVGRSDGTINFVGTLIYPQYIYDAILKNKNLLKTTTNKFKLMAKTDKKNNPLVELHIQLRKGYAPSKKLSHEYLATLTKYFTELNNDFAKDFYFIKQKTKKNPFAVHLYQYEKYPFAKGIKVHYL